VKEECLKSGRNFEVFKHGREENKPTFQDFDFLSQVGKLSVLNGQDENGRLKIHEMG
jgi:hypothetical protein